MPNSIILNLIDRYFPLLTILVFLTAAIFNNGYYHPDEHFQILEFAYCKLGFSDIHSMPWEYQAHIRPSIQPTIAYGLMSVLYSSDITDPYFVALILRLISGMVCLGTIYMFVKSTLHTVPKNLQLLYIFLSFGIWFIPILSVRFSSETWSGISFLAGLSLVNKQGQSRADIYFAGICFGLSFLFRYQSGILIAGILCWLIIVKKERVRNILALAAALLIVLHLGLMIDAWFYGNYLLTPFRYLTFNLIHGIASSFGESPWHEILSYIIFYPTSFLGSVIICSLLIVSFRRSQHFLVWCLLPFIIIHMIIPHKELRFLFPIAWLIPLTVVIGIEELSNLNFIRSLNNKIVTIFLLIFILINSIAVTTAMFSPSGMGETAITQYIAREFKDKRVNLLYGPGSNIYSQYELLNNFYRNPQVNVIYINTLHHKSSFLSNGNVINLLVTKGDVSPNLFGKKNKLIKLTQSTPSIIKLIKEFGYRPDKENIFVLYEVLK